jgi:hypothetical protein
VYARHPADLNGKDAWIKRVEKLATVWWREKNF